MLPLVGLNVTLKRHCDTIEQHHQVKVLFSAPDDLGSLSPHVALCLFRVAQEALTNAVRYARAHTIRVCLASRNDSIDLEDLGRWRRVRPRRSHAKRTGASEHR